MPSILKVTTSFVDDHFEIVAEIQEGGTLPKEIFIYENSGTDELGGFYGTCSLEELHKLRIFTGSAIKVFANRFVRYGQAKIKVNSEAEISGIISALVENVRDLSTQYQEYTPTVESFNID